MYFSVSLVVGSPPRHSSRPVVYTDGCCFSNGQKNAHGGVGVYWGKDHAQLSARYNTTKDELLFS